MLKCGGRSLIPPPINCAVDQPEQGRDAIDKVIRTHEGRRQEKVPPSVLAGDTNAKNETRKHVDAEHSEGQPQRDQKEETTKARTEGAQKEVQGDSETPMD